MANFFCTKCGQQVPDTATACPSCGAARTAGAAPPESPSTAAPLPAQDFSSSSSSSAKGFFATLADTSFSEFITLRLITLFYIIGCIIVAIGAVIFGLYGFSMGIGIGLLTLIIGAPIIAIVGIVLVRVQLEFLSAIFRVAENTTVMVKDLERR